MPDLRDIVTFVRTRNRAADLTGRTLDRIRVVERNEIWIRSFLQGDRNSKYRRLEETGRAGRGPSDSVCGTDWRIRFDLIRCFLMKTLTVTEVARNFSAVMDRVETVQEEIVLIRNNRPVARLVPEPTAQNALEVLGDLYRTMDDATAASLLQGVRKSRTGRTGLKDLRNPWDS